VSGTQTVLRGQKSARNWKLTVKRSFDDPLIAREKLGGWKDKLNNRPEC
jgi:hypothetical protein